MTDNRGRRQEGFCEVEVTPDSSDEVDVHLIEDLPRIHRGGLIVSGLPNEQMPSYLGR